MIGKQYLEEKYVDRKWSTVKIAKEQGCDPKTVNYWLKKHGLGTRNLSQSHRTEPYRFIGNKNVLYGSLLGDASLLRRNKKTGQGLASFSKANTGYDHIIYVAQAILGSDPSDRVYEYHPEGGAPSFKFTTRSCEQFSEEYDRWYNTEHKIVPNKIRLTPPMLCHWFMDDGSAVWRNKRRTKILLRFATESFTERDCHLLRKRLDKDLGLGSYLVKSHGGFGSIICLRAESVSKFFEVIGPCPVPSLAYKWKG